MSYISVPIKPRQNFDGNTITGNMISIELQDIIIITKDTDGTARLYLRDASRCRFLDTTVPFNILNSSLQAKVVQD